MIRLTNVSRTVRSGTEDLTILHPLDLEVPGGQFLAITGASGSGKSTLLSLIAGLDAPTTGEILIDGKNLTQMSEDDLADLRGATSHDGRTIFFSRVDSSVHDLMPVENFG